MLSGFGSGGITAETLYVQKRQQSQLVVTRSEQWIERIPCQHVQKLQHPSREFRFSPTTSNPLMRLWLGRVPST